MENILLHSDGRILNRNTPVTSGVLEHLGSPVETGADYTLGSFFNMLRHYPDLQRVNSVLPALLEIASSKIGAAGENVMKTEALESLVFFKVIEVHGFPGSPRLNLGNTLKGVSGKKDKDLKFFHVETLIDHTLKLGKLKHVVFGDKEDSFQYDTTYTLFELVDGIAWQLSFNFNPLQCSMRR